MKYFINDIELNLTSGLIIHQGNKTPIRAKTLLVLTYLIQHLDRIVTKQELLDAGWPDVVVQEQVLVQSIKEIRDNLPADVIKTYPKTGYQWTGELQSAEKRAKATLGKRAILTLIALTGFGLSLFYVSFDNASEKSTKVSLAFLPVENDMPDALHQWVPLKGMDYLIQQLSPQPAFKVLASHDLLDGLGTNEPLTQLPVEDKLLQLASKLELDLVISTRLSGYPQDFQLHYRIDSADHVLRGVELADSVTGAFDLLVERIVQRYGVEAFKRVTPYQSDFSNQAFANGLEYYLNRNYHQAIPLFQAALSSDPALLMARRYLAASLANQGKVEQGIDLMKDNIAAAKKVSNAREEIRSYVMIGYLMINWPQPQENRQQALKRAQQYIETGQRLAQRHQDKLFIAYAYEELGKIKRLQKQYHQAEALLNQSLIYHQSFNSHYGQTNALNQLARMAAETHEPMKAERYFQQAMDIANHSGTPVNQIWTLLARADVARQQDQPTQANQLAHQAREIAQSSQRAYLISRVEAWFNAHSIYELH